MTAYEEIDALNWSTLKHLAVSPRMLRWRAEHPRPDTDALARGRAIHCAVLEPERFQSAYVTPPRKWDRRYKDQKAEAAVWLGSLPPGVEVLDADEYELVERCAAAVLGHPKARELISGGRAEETVTWDDEETGVACKARLDYVTPFYVLDVKSTRQQTLRGIVRDFASLLYHAQLGFYFDAAVAARLTPAMANGPFTIAVQTVEPFDVVPGRLMAEDLQKGRALYRSFLRTYLDCQAAGWWPGLAPDVVDLELPQWAPGGDEQTEEADW